MEAKSQLSSMSCREPAIAAVSAAVKEQQERLGGKVKVTAFDDMAVPQQQQSEGPALYEALVFPAGEGC